MTANQPPRAPRHKADLLTDPLCTALAGVVTFDNNSVTCTDCLRIIRNHKPRSSDGEGPDTRKGGTRSVS